jgi:Zn-dependent metalloprotease
MSMAPKSRKSAKKAARATSVRATSASTRQSNGLTRFSMHALDKKSARQFEALKSERRGYAGFAGAPTKVADMDPESAARLYLKQALESDAVPGFTAPVADGAESEYRSLGTEAIPLTGTTMVKFRQQMNQIPVYGSLVSVELDEHNELLSISSAAGKPAKVDPVARISPAEAMAIVEKAPGLTKVLDGITPQLNYYYDVPKSKWRLVYIAQDVPVGPAKKGKTPSRVPLRMDFVVDAHSGQLVARLPRTAMMAAITETATDGFGASRTFEADKTGAKKTMVDASLNIQTFDFRFKDLDNPRNTLPGGLVANPPTWDPGAVSAHANAAVVAQFMRNALGRNGIDNRGGTLISSINCVASSQPGGPREWLNAAWVGTQMVYGQRRKGFSLLSLAANVDVVGHEMFHGVTDHTSRLEYQGQSGAMNESYSDIFGILISNLGRALDAFDWELGEGLFAGGRALRDLSDPTRFRQPKHMRDFVVTTSDHGGVHTNSGIHNFAAFKVMTAKDAAGHFVFTPQQCAAIFYLTLTQRLSRTSQFIDSRLGAVASAQSLFRNDPPATRTQRIQAVEKGFSAAGIV